MTPERWKRVQHVFQATVERTPAERSAFLDAQRGDDVELRAEVVSLLESHELTAPDYSPSRLRWNVSSSLFA